MEGLILLFFIFGIPFIIFLCSIYGGTSLTNLKNERQELENDIESEFECEDPLPYEEDKDYKSNMYRMIVTDIGRREDGTEYNMYHIDMMASILGRVEMEYLKSEAYEVVNEISLALCKIAWFEGWDNWYSVHKTGRVDISESVYRPRTLFIETFEEMSMLHNRLTIIGNGLTFLLKHLLTRIGTEKGYNMSFFNIDAYEQMLKEIKIQAPIRLNGYEPSYDMWHLRKEFLRCELDYVLDINDKTYNCMYEAFKDYYNFLIQE